MTLMFRPAVKEEAKLRLAFIGPSGSGKTYSSLAVATHLAENSRIAVVDTEHGSASKYAGDPFDFDVINMEPPFHPDRFIEAIRAAEAANYDVLIIDSLSHAWSGSGGLLELVDQFAARMKTHNSFAAWKDATPIQNRLIEAIVGANIHIIAAMRSKQEYVLEQVERGGKTITVPRKVGMAPVQRDSMEFEFDVVIDMNMENEGIVQKTRCPALTGAVIDRPGADLAQTLREWLRGAKPPTPEELGQMAREAQHLNAFADAAYRLPGPAHVFEGQQRLVDWYGYVAGDFNPAQNELMLDVLDSYCTMVADGVKVKKAAEAARKQVQAVAEAEAAAGADEEE